MVGSDMGQEAVTSYREGSWKSAKWLYVEFWRKLLYT